MVKTVERPDAPAAIRTDIGAIFVSLELSRSTWLLTSVSPGAGEKMSQHATPAGDLRQLFECLAELKRKALARTKAGVAELNARLSQGFTDAEIDTVARWLTHVQIKFPRGEDE